MAGAPLLLRDVCYAVWAELFIGVSSFSTARGRGKVWVASVKGEALLAEVSLQKPCKCLAVASLVAVVFAQLRG